jgi:fructokinase
MKNKHFFGSVEAGGTKFVCAIGFDNVIIEKIVIKTQTPKVTLTTVIDFFLKSESYSRLKAIAIGFFGPIDLDINSSSYGCLGNTPKVGWSGVNVIKLLKTRLKNIPLVLATDVELAAIGEDRYGIAKDYNDFLYLTVGTGIGGCIIKSGEVTRGRSHSEFGHIPITKMPADSFIGNCKYHQDSCLEGCASGSATVMRNQMDTNGEDSLEIQAWYLGAGILTYIYSFSPKLIVIGGGSMENKSLLKMIRIYVLKHNADYMDLNKRGLDSYIVETALNGEAAIIGGFCLAKSCNYQN